MLHPHTKGNDHRYPPPTTHPPPTHHPPTTHPPPLPSATPLPPSVPSPFDAPNYPPRSRGMPARRTITLTLTSPRLRHTCVIPNAIHSPRLQAVRLPTAIHTHAPGHPATSQPANRPAPDAASGPGPGTYACPVAHTHGLYGQGSSKASACGYRHRPHHVMGYWRLVFKSVSFTLVLMCMVWLKVGTSVVSV